MIWLSTYVLHLLKITIVQKHRLDVSFKKVTAAVYEVKIVSIVNHIFVTATFPSKKDITKTIVGKLIIFF